jgi:hypothetical protein
MVSSLHEGVLKLVQDRPAFTAELLNQVLDIKVPQFRKARVADATLTEVVPSEYRVDAAVVFEKKEPVFGIIVESQLKPDPDKQFTWPLYATGARERHRCPFVVVVVTPKRATARWASQPIELGGGVRYWPLVIGPDGVPEVTDRAQARRDPQLAVLSALLHGRGKVEIAAAIGAAAAHSVSQFPEDQRQVYSMLLAANLSEAARKAIEMQPEFEKFFSEAQRRSYERAHAKGEAKGKADGLLKILMQRGLALTAEQRRRIGECTDVALLDRWFDRALSASSVAELLAPPTRARKVVGGGHRRAPLNGSRRKTR